MSRYIALDAEQAHLYLASVVIKGSAVKVEQALTLSDVGALSRDNAGEIGRRIKEAMKEVGIAPAPVLVSVGRERVVLKEVKYPANVPAADEPALIRFQVSKEMAESGDNVVIDYFAQPTPDPDGQRRALAFAVRKDVLNAARAAALAAGLRIAAITPRPFGIAASLMRAIKEGAVTPPESPSAPVAILVRGDKWGELVILRGGHVAFTRSLTAMALNTEAAMLGEIRRNLAVFAGQSPTGAVQTVFVAEGEMPGGWAGRIRAGLNLPVQSFDPIGGVASDVPPEARGSFAGPTGLAALRARSAELPVNFLAPREPVTRTDPNKKMVGMIAAAAAVLLVGGIAAGLFLAGKKESEERRMRAQKTELEEDIKKLDEVAKRVKAVQDWENKNINWLDQLYDVVAAFPDPAGTELVQFVGQPFDPGKNSTKKHSAEMQLTINTGVDRAVQGTFSSQIAALKHREITLVQPKGTTGGTGGFSRGSNKNQQYFVKVLIEKVAPSQFTARIDAAPTLKRERPRDESRFDFGAGLGGGFGGFGMDALGGFGMDGLGTRPDGKGGRGGKQ